MQVLHVTQNYFPSIGGTQYMIQHVSEYLHAQYGDDVTVLTTNSFYGPNNALFKKIETREEKLNGVTVKRFPFQRLHKPFLKVWAKTNQQLGGGSMPAIINAWNAGPLSASLKQAMNHTPADVLCASSVHYRFADYGRWRNTLQTPKPFVLYGALHLADGTTDPQYIRRIRAADQYIANSTYEKDFLIAHKIEPEKITVAGGGISLDAETIMDVDTLSLKAIYKIPANAKIITCISRQEAFKGLPVLVEAFRLLMATEKNYYLLLAGASGNYTQALQEVVKEIPRLSVFTDISSTVKAQLLQMADVVVLPSKAESFGVLFLEAWRARKPVIGAAIGAIRSIISEGQDGFLFQPDNAVELAEKIKALFMHPGKAREMGNNGYEKVKQQYTWETIAGKFRMAYEKAIDIFHREKK